MSDIDAEYRALLGERERHASTVDHEALMRDLDILADRGERL